MELANYNIRVGSFNSIDVVGRTLLVEKILVWKFSFTTRLRLELPFVRACKDTFIPWFPYRLLSMPFNLISAYQFPFLATIYHSCNFK